MKKFGAIVVSVLSDSGSGAKLVRKAESGTLRPDPPADRQQVSGQRTWRRPHLHVRHQGNHDHRGRLQGVRGKESST